MSLHPGKPSIAGAFSAVAAYNLDNDMPILANFRHVLDALSENRKAGLALSEIEAFVSRDFTKASEKNALSYISGSNPFGYAISFVVAHDDRGKNTYLPVIFDKLQDKTLVVGPAKLPPGAMRELRKANVTYVNQHDGTAASKINDFLVDTARYRGNNNLLGPEQVHGLITGMLGAVALAGATDGNPLDSRSTMGAILIRGLKAQAKPNIYVAAKRPRILTPV